MIGEVMYVNELDELPPTDIGYKYFACIGGPKNYQCILESRTLSRAVFMNKYRQVLDVCHLPVYEDSDLVITQDAQIALPGFYIIAPKQMNARRISDLSLTSYQKCLQFASKVKGTLLNHTNCNAVYIYYDEHLVKPSSVHVWALPIYKDITDKNHLNASIHSLDIWKYLDLFRFSEYGEKIINLNTIVRDSLL